MHLDDFDISIPEAPSCFFKLFTWLKGTSDRSPSGVTDAQTSRTAHVSEPGVMSLHKRSFWPTQTLAATKGATGNNPPNAAGEVLARMGNTTDSQGVEL